MNGPLIARDCRHPWQGFYAEGSRSLASWLGAVRGRPEALIAPVRDDSSAVPFVPSPVSATHVPCPLAAALAPLFVAVGALHRAGFAHGCLTPEAARVSPNGACCPYTCAPAQPRTPWRVSVTRVRDACA